MPQEVQDLKVCKDNQHDPNTQTVHKNSSADLTVNDQQVSTEEIHETQPPVSKHQPPVATHQPPVATHQPPVATHHSSEDRFIYRNEDFPNLTTSYKRPAITHIQDNDGFTTYLHKIGTAQSKPLEEYRRTVPGMQRSRQTPLLRGVKQEKGTMLYLEGIAVGAEQNE